MKLRRIVVGCAVVGVVALGATAAVVHATAAVGRATPKTVAVTVAPTGNLVFSPSTAKLHIGDTVKWTWGATGHTSTDESGLALWDTGVQSVNHTFSFLFGHAGTYNYECTVHFFLGMKGKVQVSPRAAVSGTSAAVTWASAAPPSGFVEDVQSEAPGGAFATVETGSSTVSHTFSSLTTGTWKFRARYRNTTTAKMTAWSPAAKAVIS